MFEVIPIKTMEPVKQLDSQFSQETRVQEPPAPAMQHHLLHLPPVLLQHMNLNVPVWFSVVSSSY